MFCKNCGTKIENNSKFCTNCGAPTSNTHNRGNETLKTKKSTTTTAKKQSSLIGKIVTVFLILTVVGVGVYLSLDEDSIEKNNEGLTSFDSGDSQTAINQLQEAKGEAITNENKINTLKNLGYVYSSEEQNLEALKSFKEALNLTKNHSFDYYLISGEIAELENNPTLAVQNYNKAYEIDPNDFQVNNSLALFYLDLDEIAPQYVDYPKALSYAKKAYEYDLEKQETIKQNLAIAHYFNNNFNQTISLLSTSNYTQHPYAAFWLGLAYLEKEDDLNAKFYLQKAVNGGAEVPQLIHDYLNND